MNPFFNQNANQQPSNTPFGQMSNMMNQFNEFRNNFRGDPRQKVQELLNSGKMTQQQFNQLSQLAQQFQKFFR